ncbi:hypothetical protein CTZ27_30885 [Streptomyces griseocarneus]|nr:hypothetical protein CTZ27_30885 [Streptomyces griseocarneus]
MPQDIPTLDGQMYIGRPSQGKPRLAPDSVPEDYFDQLRRAAFEIERRQAAPGVAVSTYVVFADATDLIDRHPDHAELRQLLADISAHGPEVDVRLVTSPTA